MSRIEEALKRARLNVGLPEPGGAPTGGLEAFPAGSEDRVAEVHDIREGESLRQKPVLRAAPTPVLSEGREESTFRMSQLDAGPRLVISPAINPLTVEQYRRLAATLHQAQVQRGTKIVMVASALPGEGKTLTVTNLALTLSQSYRRRVLLIDADLRRPTLHTLFQVPNDSGLSDCLHATEDRSLALVEVTNHLSVLPAGRPDPDPMALVTSPRMKRVIGEAGALYDWVVIDTPPVGLLPDADLLSAMVDAIVLVIGAGRTPFAVVQRSVETLGRDRIIGVVLNRADDIVTGDGYHRYYGDYSERA